MGLSILPLTGSNAIAEIRPSYDERFQSLFIAYVDKLTPLSIGLLSFFNKTDWLNPYMGRQLGNPKDFVFEIVWEALPALKDRVDTTEYLFRDLKNQGLLSQGWETPENIGIHSGSSIPRVTQLGKDFMDFIGDKQVLQHEFDNS